MGVQGAQGVLLTGATSARTAGEGSGQRALTAAGTGAAPTSGEVAGSEPERGAGEHITDLKLRPHT